MGVEKLGSIYQIYLKSLPQIVDLQTLTASDDFERQITEVKYCKDDVIFTPERIACWNTTGSAKAVALLLILAASASKVKWFSIRRESINRPREGKRRHKTHRARMEAFPFATRRTWGRGRWQAELLSRPGGDQIHSCITRALFGAIFYGLLMNLACLNLPVPRACRNLPTFIAGALFAQLRPWAACMINAKHWRFCVALPLTWE